MKEASLKELGSVGRIPHWPNRIIVASIPRNETENRPLKEYKTIRLKMSKMKLMELLHTGKASGNFVVELDMEGLDENDKTNSRR